MWKRISENEYSCLSTDAKAVSDVNDVDGIAEGAVLVEVQPDGSIKTYKFYQGGWRGGWVEPKSGLIIGDALMQLTSDATGDIYYRNAAGKLTRLPIGTVGKTLKSDGTIPYWA